MNRVAIYIRLSKEDLNGSTSESVVNQKSLLTKYVKDNNFVLFDTYIDDGYSGTNFDRPAFKKMIKDIESNLIDVVIVKDLSRLGRDYIKTGEYIEKWFPIHNIRFIALLDGIDTLYDLSSNEMAPFKSVINDMYSRDNSKKIKMALRTKQEDGKWVGGCPPFGYMKDENDKNHLIINKEEVVIVKKIFSLFLKGHSINYIANYLSKQNIPTPSIIRGKKSKYASFGIWSPITIKNILTNELYTGNMVQNRRKKVNYKIKKIIKNDRSSWIVVNNTHEAIISEKEFDLVNKLLKANNKLLHHNKRLFEGLVYCSSCNKRLILQKGKYEYFVCNTYRKYSRLGLCTNHSISNDKLEYEILSILKKLTNMENISDRSLIIKLINKIVVHEDKEVDVYFNFKSPVLSPSM
ncbi:MAG: recombinase family protein [Bacilli bacterium]|nr:recombinase family protein [Bacilli bacterium]